MYVNGKRNQCTFLSCVIILAFFVSCVMGGCFSLFVGTKTAQAAGTNVTIDINTGSIIQSDFLGFGINHPEPGYTGSYDDDTWNNIIAKRYKESFSNSLVRYFYDVDEIATGVNNYNWSTYTDNIYRLNQLLEDINTDVYMVNRYWNGQPSWLNSGYMITDPTMLSDWGEVHADILDYFINTKGLSNIKYWAVTNELQTKDGWNYFGSGNGYPRMQNYKDHNQVLFDRFSSHNLAGKVGILATDAGDVAWHTMPNWAVPNMDSMVTVYGGHWYPNNRDEDNKWDWDDPKYYWTAYNSYKNDGSDPVASTGKGFILGEFGGVTTNDGVESWYLGEGEPRLAIHHAERMVAGLNAGFKSMLKWTAHDNQALAKYQRYGWYKGSRDNYAVKPEYYTVGLLSRYFHKNSEVYQTTSSNDKVHAGAVKDKTTGKYSIVVINREKTPAPVTINFSNTGLNTTMRKFIYDPNNQPVTVNGDLPDYIKTVTVSSGSLSDTIPVDSMVIYTNDYDTSAPPAVQNVSPTSGNSSENTISWSANTATDLAYYRIYRGTTASFTPSRSNQIGSTIATTYTDKNGTLGTTYYYKINAVDKYGNETGFSVPTSYAPTALNESYRTAKNAQVSGNVMDNDYDYDNNTLTATKLSDPVHGSVTLNSNGSFTYTPNSGFEGDDSFTYRVSYGSLQSNTATVSVRVAYEETADLNAEALWKMEGTTYDNSGNSHDGIFTSGAFVTGKKGQALELYGTGGVNVGGMDLGNQFSIAGWVWVDGTSSGGALISNTATGTISDGFKVLVGADGKIRFENGDGKLANAASTDINQFTLDTWNHIAIVADKTAGTCRIYVNGVDVTMDSGTTTAYDTNAIYMIGQTANGYSRLDGKIDELSVFKRKLTTDELQTHMNDVGPVITTVFEDGFESGGFTQGGWVNSGANVQANTIYEGLYSTRLNLTDTLEKSKSTAGYHNIKVKYVSMVENFASGDHFIVEWYDGSTWIPLEDAVVNYSWTQKEWNLPSTANNNPAFKIRFKTTNILNSHSAYIDNIAILGSE